MINGKEIQKVIFAGGMLMFASLTLFFIAEDSTFFRIFGLLSFGYFTCGLMAALLYYYYPNSAPIKKFYFKITGKNEFTQNQDLKKDFMEIYNDDGIFTFFENSFSIKFENSVDSINWSEINSMIAYKMDLYTTDLICLEIYCSNNLNFKINEETPGWFRFIENSKKMLPNITENWESSIVLPAFATNLTLIYDKENRNLEEVTKGLNEKKGSL
ncbi:hypothetical protein [Flavobacterium suncheonense]|uniref:Uncharacterized protein n=1 Tax=Flavobacterium suncheonense GH29-5 = DSM 17707 TaxID=1121899 RepID=A0A0A2MEI0_9FLAO|nr:hypothetical protein [Flavobacterium suncheonense]KGO86680.1 hypothetical protein Q764_13640 [Flavobacterium suncheonense GH29-5 = DSM 17707]